MQEIIQKIKSANSIEELNSIFLGLNRDISIDNKKQILIAHQSKLNDLFRENGK